MNKELLASMREQMRPSEEARAALEDALALLDAPRRVGLCATDSDLLTPRKSVTAILGVAQGALEQKKRSCLGCPAQGSCQYRKAGGHCGIS